MGRRSRCTATAPSSATSIMTTTSSRRSWPARRNRRPRGGFTTWAAGSRGGAPVPFLDLRAQCLSIQPEIDAALASVFASGRFILGEQVAAFEREFAAYCGARHAVGVGSGTEAIHLALLACGIGAGDE